MTSSLSAFGRAGAFVYVIYAVLYYLQTGKLPNIAALGIGPITLLPNQSVPTVNVVQPPPPTPTPPPPVTCGATCKTAVKNYQQDPLVAHGPGGAAVVLSPAYYKNAGQPSGYSSLGQALSANGFFVNRMSNSTPILGYQGR